MQSGPRRRRCRFRRLPAAPRRSVAWLHSGADGSPGRRVHSSSEDPEPGLLLRRRDDRQQREQPRRARPSARVPSKPTVQHVGQPRQATAVTGRSASEIGPTTPTRMIARTATARPTAPLERCLQSEPLASGERRVVAAAGGTSHIVDISFRYVRRSRADHVRPRPADCVDPATTGTCSVSDASDAHGTDDRFPRRAGAETVIAHRTSFRCLDRRRERATIACPSGEGLPKTSPSRRW